MLSVIGSLMVGGAETYVTRIARTISQYGVDMEICALERHGPLLQDLEAEGITVHGTRFDTSDHRSTVARVIHTMDIIRRIVKKGQFDVVHTYLYWSDVLAVPAARLAGCRRTIVSRQALHSWIHSKNRRLHAMEQGANSLAHELIACCRAVLRDAEQSEQILPRARTVIYNAVEVDAYASAHPKQHGPLRLVTIGALAPRKGQEYAIEALGLLSRAGIHATLELVGIGPDEAMLRRKAAEVGVAEAITFAHFHSDPREHLRQADIFLLPSRQEGFSLALLEAMASALPAVVTDVGGNSEAIVDGLGGLIVPPAQPEAIAAAVSRLDANRPLLAEMGKFNRSRVRDLFSIENSARLLSNWYINGPSTS